MIKKIAASVLALTMIMGTGVLPAVNVLPDTAITASADHLFGDFRFDYSEGTDSVTITKYVGSSTSVTIPSVIKGGAYNGKKVSAIGSGAFKGNEKVTSVTIPNGVTTIRFEAFSGCKNLKTINIPASVNTIQDFAFESCTSLKGVKIPNGVKEIAGYTFYNCTSLTSVTIPNSVIYMNDYSFQGCSSLKSIDIPNSVEEIYFCAFEGCTSMKSVSIPSSVTFIGEGAFGYKKYDDLILWGATKEKISDFKIYCYEGTMGEQYAIDNKFTYQIYKKSDYPGNVNGDDKIDVADISKLINHINGAKALDSAQFKRADVNGDGKVDVSDAAAITNHINGVKSLY